MLQSTVALHPCHQCTSPLPFRCGSCCDTMPNIKPITNNRQLAWEHKNRLKYLTKNLQKIKGTIKTQPSRRRRRKELLRPSLLVRSLRSRRRELQARRALALRGRTPPPLQTHATHSRTARHSTPQPLALVKRRSPPRSRRSRSFSRRAAQASASLKATSRTYD